MMFWGLTANLAAFVELSCALALAMRRITAKQFFGSAALIEGFQIISTLHVIPVLAPLHVAVMVFQLWMWWRFGGGDDTRRRWRQLKTKFQGVRRTAPVSA